MEHMDTCKESIRILLKDCGFQNITIEFGGDLETHQTHKRTVCDLERSYSIKVRKSEKYLGTILFWIELFLYYLNISKIGKRRALYKLEIYDC